MSARQQLEDLIRLLNRVRAQDRQSGTTPLPVVLVPPDEFEAAYIAVAALPPDHPRFFLAPDQCESMDQWEAIANASPTPTTQSTQAAAASIEGDDDED